MLIQPIAVLFKFSQSLQFPFEIFKSSLQLNTA